VISARAVEARAAPRRCAGDRGFARFFEPAADARRRIARQADPFTDAGRVALSKRKLRARGTPPRFRTPASRAIERAAIPCTRRTPWRQERADEGIDDDFRGILRTISGTKPGSSGRRPFISTEKPDTQNNWSRSVPGFVARFREGLPRAAGAKPEKLVLLQSTGGFEAVFGRFPMGGILIVGQPRAGLRGGPTHRTGRPPFYYGPLTAGDLALRDAAGIRACQRAKL